jgi:hypothetical protein
MIGCPAAATATIEPGVFADTVSVVAGAFADTVSITLRPYIGADTTFKVRVTRTTVTPPSSGKLPIVRTVKTAASTEVTAGCDTLSNGPGGFSIGMNFPYSECYGTFTQAAGLDSGTTNWNTVWCPSCDDSSYMGSPQFVDSTRANFDAHIGFGSLAIGNALDESDIGAVAYVPEPICGYFPSALEFIQADGSLTQVIQFCNLQDSTYKDNSNAYLVVSATLSPHDVAIDEYTSPLGSKIRLELVEPICPAGSCALSLDCGDLEVSYVPTFRAPERGDRFGIPIPDDGRVVEPDPFEISILITTNDPRRPSFTIPVRVY